MSRPIRKSRVLPEGQGPRLLTARELARVLCLNEQTLYRMARRGEIPCVRIGRKAIRFDLEQVRGTLEQKPMGWGSEVRALGEFPFAFTWLEDIRTSKRWPVPPTDLTLERFAVELPPGVDLTALAYEREAS